MTAAHKPIGRPPLPAGAAKTARIELRVRPAVKAEWQARAAAEGLTLHAWIERELTRRKERRRG